MADLAHKLGEEQPGRSKMRRWSVEELREEAAVFSTVEAEPIGEVVLKFISWLEDQGRQP